MSIYHFSVTHHGSIVYDQIGEDLPSPEAAQAFAKQTILELMRNQESKTRSWRMRVCDAEGNHCFEMLFAVVDHSIAHLPPEVRETIHKTATRMASLSDAIIEARHSMRQVKATVGRGKNRPYLAVADGRKT